MICTFRRDLIVHVWVLSEYVARPLGWGWYVVRVVGVIAVQYAHFDCHTVQVHHPPDSGRGLIGGHTLVLPIDIVVEMSIGFPDQSYTITFLLQKKKGPVALNFLNSYWGLKQSPHIVQNVNHLKTLGICSLTIKRITFQLNLFYGNTGTQTLIFGLLRH